MKILLLLALFPVTVSAQGRNSWNVNIGIGFPDFIHFSLRYFVTNDLVVEGRLGGFPIFKNNSALSYGLNLQHFISKRWNRTYFNIGLSDLVITFDADTSMPINTSGEDLLGHVRFLEFGIANDITLSENKFFLEAGPSYLLWSRSIYHNYNPNEVTKEDNTGAAMRWLGFCRFDIVKQ